MHTHLTFKDSILLKILWICEKKCYFIEIIFLFFIHWTFYIINCTIVKRPRIITRCCLYWFLSFDTISLSYFQKTHQGVIRVFHIGTFFEFWVGNAQIYSPWAWHRTHSDFFWWFSEVIFIAPEAIVIWPPANLRIFSQNMLYYIPIWRWFQKCIILCIYLV